jgi:hypothetical protein
VLRGGRRVFADTLEGIDLEEVWARRHDVGAGGEEV